MAKVKQVLRLNTKGTAEEKVQHTKQGKLTFLFGMGSSKNFTFLFQNHSYMACNHISGWPSQNRTYLIIIQMYIYMARGHILARLFDRGTCFQHGALQGEALCQMSPALPYPTRPQPEFKVFISCSILSLRRLRYRARLLQLQPSSCDRWEEEGSSLSPGF